MVSIVFCREAAPNTCRHSRSRGRSTVKQPPPGWHWNAWKSVALMVPWDCVQGKRKGLGWVGLRRTREEGSCGAVCGGVGGQREADGPG